MTKKQLKHIESGLPFRYNKYDFSPGRYVITASPTPEPGQYYLRCLYEFQDGKFSTQPDTAIGTIEKSKLRVFISNGAFNAFVEVKPEQIQLLNTDYTPLT